MSKNANNEKLSIEHRAFKDFMEKFKKGKYGTQRLGQAFYDEFKLHRLSNQEQLQNIYAKDGEHARRSICAIFEFT